MEKERKKITADQTRNNRASKRDKQRIQKNDRKKSKNDF